MTCKRANWDFILAEQILENFSNYMNQYNIWKIHNNMILEFQIIPLEKFKTTLSFKNNGLQIFSSNNSKTKILVLMFLIKGKFMRRGRTIIF